MSRTISKKSQNSFRDFIVRWALALILAGGCVYLIIDKERSEKNSAETRRQQQQTIDSLSTNRLYLQADFNAASAGMDQLMSKNMELKDSLNDKIAAISELQAQIRIILTDDKASRNELTKAKGLIYVLIEKMREYELDLAELEKDNTDLTRQNSVLEKERSNTVERNIALKMAGMVLHASNIRIEFIKEHRNGKESATRKAGRVDKIRVMFDIDENGIAESGLKQVYIRIIAPNGDVLSSNRNSNIIHTVNSGEIQFTILKEIDLVKGEPFRDIFVDWQPTGNLANGTYRIELYNWGNKIGEASKKLK